MNFGLLVNQLRLYRYSPTFMLANAILLMLILELVAPGANNKLANRRKRGDDIHIYICGTGGTGRAGCGYGGYGGYGYMFNPYMMYMMNPMMMYGGFGYGYGGYGYGGYGGIIPPTTIGTVTRQCIGPCVNGQCPAGYTCIGEQCCR